MEGEDGSFVTVERRDGVVAITLSRPETGNALAPEMVAALTAALSAVRDDGSVRSLLLRGEGRHFTTGGDAREFARLLDASAGERRVAFERLMAKGAAMIAALAAIEVPVVLACRGAVAGGGLALLLAADVVLADRSATLLFSHRRVGLPPDGGVSWLLPRVVGQRRATQLILEGATVDAQAALDIGLVSRLVDADVLDEQAWLLARHLADGPTRSLRAAKRLLRRSEDTTLAEQLALETGAILDAIEAPDFAEGTRAFLERRAPIFSRDG